MKVFITERFSLYGKDYAPPADGQANVLQDVPDKEVPSLIKKRLVALPEESDLQTPPSPLESELVGLLTPLQQGEEGPADTLRRLISEGESSRTELDGARTRNRELLTIEQGLREQVGTLQDMLTATQNQLAAASNDNAGTSVPVASDSTQEQTPSAPTPPADPGELATAPSNGENLADRVSTPEESPVDVDALSKATTAPVAIAILNAGFETVEKLRAATDQQLLAIDGIGEAMLAKVRAFTKDAQE